MPVIASFNVNSLRAHLSHVTEWLKRAKPDVALLQEIKCQDHEAPLEALEELGYNVALSGQKTYNGVAILSRTPIHIEQKGLPGNGEDSQARYLEAIIDHPEGKTWKAYRVACIYLPNGNPSDTEKFTYKLGWMDKLLNHAKDLLRHEEPVILGGDYNVIPQEDDVYDPAEWIGDALFHPESRKRYRTLLNFGYVDALRACHPEGHYYTFWDYKAGRWARNEGLRIDHLVLSPQAADGLVECAVDKEPRKKEKPSDHTPIWCRLDF